MNRRSFLTALAACLSPLACSRAQRTLYAQSIQAELSRADPHLDLLVFDPRTSHILANTFPEPSRPIPVGSLLKPFLAFAYLGQPSPARISVSCHGHSDQCWKSGGHGALSLPQALAQSCNAYFLALARTLQPERITLPCVPPDDPTPEDLIGLTSRWLVSPTALVQAYAQLLSARPASILEGMSLAGTTGTAARVGRHRGGVLAKTGTAPCIQSRIPGDAPCKATGDGLVLAAAPAGNPVLLLLVRRRATTGAFAAASAGTILSRLEALHAL